MTNEHTDSNGGSHGTERRPERERAPGRYEAPRILSIEPLEAVAALCPGPPASNFGKETNIECSPEFGFGS